MLFTYNSSLISVIYLCMLLIQSFIVFRHLLCGKVSGDIKSNPEFVAPEIIDRKYPITLAADMWSVGTLTCK